MRSNIGLVLPVALLGLGIWFGSSPACKAQGGLGGALSGAIDNAGNAVQGSPAPARTYTYRAVAKHHAASHHTVIVHRSSHPTTIVPRKVVRRGHVRVHQ